MPIRKADGHGATLQPHFWKADGGDALLHHAFPQSRRTWCNAASLLSVKRTDTMQRCITAFRKANGHDATMQHARSESEEGFRNGAEGLSRFGFEALQR
jgi:hypothetical protein